MNGDDNARPAKMADALRILRIRRGVCSSARQQNCLEIARTITMNRLHRHHFNELMYMAGIVLIFHEKPL